MTASQTKCACGYQADDAGDLQRHLSAMRGWLTTPVGSHRALDGAE